MIDERLAGSFRDPAGFVFKTDGIVHRRITSFGIEEYRQLQSSGLYESLVDKEMLIPHEEGSSSFDGTIDITPRQIGFVSYPYEWCFSQLKDAALLVLSIQELALEHGMSLKDASAYNVQFEGVKPVFIDTTSFERYVEGKPWIAYRQFCEHFLAPLLLMSRVDGRLSRLSRTLIDGIPLEVAAKSVKRSTWLNPWLYMHVRLHAKAKGTRSKNHPDRAVSRQAALGLLKTLRAAVESLKWNGEETAWSSYSSGHSYQESSAREKHELIATYLGAMSRRPQTVWDVGANSGEFSRIFSKENIYTLALDGDHTAVDKNYRQAHVEGDRHLLPLVQDFTNPSPSLGWRSEERSSLIERGPADLVLCLALIHHLVIGNSVPMGQVTDFFAALGNGLIIEFVDPEDRRVQQLLSSRTSSQPYDYETFRQAFEKRFDVLRSDPIAGSKRTLHHMRLKAS